jgi:hypothetical protein
VNYPPLASRGWVSPEWSTAEQCRKTAIFITALCMLYLSFGGIESYCYLIPTIDTRYASGCSELRFRLIDVGMTREEVVQRIGQPLGKGRYHREWHPAYKERGDEIWHYTTDGAAAWGDWAWLSRELIFREGRVVQKVYWTFYD